MSFDTAFPFVVKPPGIDPKPIFSREDTELGRCLQPKVRKADAEPAEPHTPHPAREPELGVPDPTILTAGGSPHDNTDSDTNSIGVVWGPEAGDTDDDCAADHQDCFPVTFFPDSLQARHGAASPLKLGGSLSPDKKRAAGNGVW